jgi:hypothetical protein|tara:strand:+ start:210 stop:506 length:297 start_codon:yes stop_codon:yes gene_type:complete
MKLTQLATKPQLTKITIDEPVLVEKYGEPVDFYIHDKINLEQYTQLASIKTEDLGSMIGLIKELVLDENGKQVMDEEHVLPTDLLNACMVKVVDTLGK